MLVEHQDTGSLDSDDLDDGIQGGLAKIIQSAGAAHPVGEVVKALDDIWRSLQLLVPRSLDAHPRSPKVAMSQAPSYTNSPMASETAGIRLPSPRRTLM